MYSLRLGLLLKVLLFGGLWAIYAALHYPQYQNQLSDVQEQTRLAINQNLRSAQDLTETKLQQQLTQLDLSFISAELAVNNTLLLKAQPQHWLLALFFPQHAQIQRVKIDNYPLSYRLNYSAYTTRIEQQAIKIASLLLIALVMSAMVLASSQRAWQRAIERIASNNSDNEIPKRFNGVSELLHSQRQLFTRQIQQQKAAIAALENQVNIDALTGAYNRNAFNKNISDYLADKAPNATLAFVHASQLNEINNHRGFRAGDDYLIDLYELIERFSSAHITRACVYRISSSDFAIILPALCYADISAFAQLLKGQIDEFANNKQLSAAAYIGFTPVKANDTFERLLSRADNALNLALSHEANAWKVVKDDAPEQLGDAHWKQTIRDVINNRSFALLRQTIRSLHRAIPGYDELFIRFDNADGSHLPTLTTINKAQQLNMLGHLETAMLEFIFEQISQHSGDQRWGINLSRFILIDKHFVTWLEQLIKRYPRLHARLVFELDEKQVEAHLGYAKHVFEILRKNSCYTAINDFGDGVSSFKLFKELKPNYVKVSHQLVSEIEDEANQQLLRMIVDASHRLNCQVIAQGVETLEQKQILSSIYVDGLQGYLIAKPQLQ